MNAQTIGTATFETALGRCGVRWSLTGITGVLLPGSRSLAGPAFEDRAVVPPFVRRAIEGMQAVLAGEAADLRDVPIDHDGVDDFRRAVYAATREIPAGTTRSYGEVARAMRLARPDGARDVG